MKLAGAQTSETGSPEQGFEPVSDIRYVHLCAGRQVLVCTLGRAADDPKVMAAWKDRAAAIFASATGEEFGGLVRDLLANPQIRALVLMGEGEGGRVIRRFWKHGGPVGGIEQQQLELVRAFVDLFDEDCGIHAALQPFWPKRIRIGR